VIQPTKAILGLGASATSHYIKRLDIKLQRKGKTFDDQNIEIVYTDFAKINQFLPDNDAELSRALLPYLNQLMSQNIGHLLIPNITLHEHLDRMIKENPQYNFSISHPLELTFQYLRKHKIGSVYILGTMYTMNNPYIIGYFEARDIKIIKPPIEIQNQIEQLRKDNFNGTKDPDRLRDIISSLNNSILPILACTELSTLNIDNTLIDMAELQIEHFIDFMSMTK